MLHSFTACIARTARALIAGLLLWCLWCHATIESACAQSRTDTEETSDTAPSQRGEADLVDALAWSEHLASRYYRDAQRRASARHWLIPKIEDIGHVVTSEGFKMLETKASKQAHLLPKLSLNTVGATVRVRF